MQALYLEDGNLRYQTDYPKPEPQLGEALVRVTKMGICSTDLELIKGYAGGFKGVLGHEFVGAVEESEDKGWLGRRVTGTINVACRQCAVCLGDGPEHCPQRTVLGIINRDGIFADYVALPVANLVPLPDSVPDETAVFTEPLAAALRIREQVRVRPTARTAVVGPGRLGMLIGKVLSLAGTEVTMLGRRPESLELPQTWGLNIGLVQEAADDGYDFVVEATGNEMGFEHSLRIVRPLGTLILKSTFAGAATLNLTKLVVGEITVVGSRCGPFEPAVRLLERQVVPVETLVEGEYALQEADDAFKHAAEPGVRKILLRP